MASDREEKIRRRAYEIWERDGRPEGREAEHWEQATREIEAEEEGQPLSETPEGPQGPESPDDAPETPENSAGSGLSSGLQPGGTLPGAGPATTEGSIGTGGGSTRRRNTGTAKRSSTGSTKTAKK